ncbi:MAG: arsenic efflux protein [Clostridia bacterium]|nr:arsenic efflux protein [Clostridia bacterium]MBQ8792171.1 arsenic efflux protein [Clostridia bacterium]
MEIFWEGLLDALKDTLFLSPLLYLTYLLVSYFSHNDNKKYSKILHRTNKAGPVVGAFLGCVPQCGFSSVMSNLYSRKIVTLGTLMAVFLATSDEAIPLMIQKPEFIPKLLLLLAVKVIYAIIAGYLIDGIIALCTRKKQTRHDYHDKHCIEHEHKYLKEEVLSEEKEFEEEQKHSPHYEEHHHEHHHDEEGECKSHCCATNIFLDALKHTLIILAYVFVITLAINLIRGYCGGLEPLQAFFGTNPYIQILLACVIGLIPNCAASVFLVELFMEGVLIFPALVAGLCAGAGVGLIVLFTCNYKHTWHNILITLLLIVLAFLGGLITNFLPIW